MKEDVQMKTPEVKIPLTRVGVTRVRKLLRIPREKGKRDIVLLANFDCFVDLPATQKGIHMSRNLEAINEIIEDISKMPVYRLEDLCADIVREILKRHGYARNGEVRMDSQLMVSSKNPSGAPDQRFVKIFASAGAVRGDSGIAIKKQVGCEVPGFLFEKTDEPDIGAIKEVRAKLEIEIPEGHHVRMWDLIRIIDETLPVRSYSRLEEGDKSRLVRHIRRNPTTSTGIVDRLLERCASRFHHLPSGTRVKASCAGTETLQTHSFEALREARIGSLPGMR